MGKKKSIGLPGGPNEFLQDITQYISVEGYKRYSDDINNPFNIIDSGNITMEGVDFPVHGIDNLGNEQIMFPENNYQFPGDMVMETPMLAKSGREIPLAQAGGESWYNDWKTFEKSNIGKFIDAKGLKKEKNFWMEQFGYEPDKEEKDAILDAAAIFNPIPDFVHALSKAKEDKYTDAALYAAFGLIPFTAAPLVRGAKEILKKGKKAVLESFTNLTDPNILPKPSATPLPKQIGFNQKGQVIPQQHMVNTNRGEFALTDALDEIYSGNPMWFAPVGDTRYFDNSLGAYGKIDEGIPFIPGQGRPIIRTINNEVGNTGKVGFNEFPLTEAEKATKINKGYNSKLVDGEWVIDYNDPIMRTELITRPGHQSKIDGIFSPDTKFKIFKSDLSKGNHAMHHKWTDAELKAIRDEGFDVIQLVDENGNQIENILLNDSKFKPTKINEMDVLIDNPPFAYGGPVGDGDLPQAQWGALGKMVKPYAKKGARYLKDLFESTNGFKSQIDWSKWNKAIPENQKLLQEYNLIEETAKANKTWMKNPDGSKFAGTPEQWVQQRSSNYKKAFGDSKLINPDGSPMVVYHGSPRKFDAFDESMYQLGDAGYSGSGIYTTPSKTTAESYTISGKRFHDGEIEPTLYELYGRGNNPITSKELIDNSGGDIGFGKVGELIDKNLPTSLFNFHRKGAPRVDQLLQYDVAIKNQNRGISNIRPIQDAWEIVFPSNKQLKSSIGNNGMFDMTDPNIYKQFGGPAGIINSIRKLATDDDYKWTDALYDNTLAPLSNALDVLSVPGALVAEAGEYFGERGDKEFNFTDAMPALKGDYSFKNINDGDMKTLSGIVDDDGNPLVENPWGAFALDVLTDPSTYVGVGAVKSLLKPGVKASVPIVKNIAKSTDDIVKATADDMVEVFTSNGTKKLLPKSKAVRLNRIEDANVNNKSFGNYEDGNWFSDSVRPFYLNNAKNTLKGGRLKSADPKRLISVYLDPADAKLFDITQGGTERALNMSGGTGNLPVKGEYVLPPELVKFMRDGITGPGYNSMIGNSESIMKNLNKFYKRLGGSFQDGTEIPDQTGLEKYQDKGEVEKNLDALNKQLAKKTYNPYRDIDEISQKRRTELTDAINFIVDNQGGDENLRDLLIMTAFMENSYGANADAYGRDYTRGPMSIDDIAYKHMFEIRKGANDYTSSQKKYIDWFDSMGYDLDNMDDYLRNDVRANVAASRYQYGTNKNPLPSSKDPKALYNYYMDTYNRTDENHYDRFLKGYNEFIGKKEFGGSVNKYLTYKKFMNGGYTGNDKIEAEKIYDKLNRMHYRDAKQRGLSPQNYIMTNLLGNS